MDWKVWRDKGFCALGTSITANVDFEPTPSGAIRCIGPFSSDVSDPVAMESAMRSLTLMIEESFLEKDQFVLWGAYCDYPDYKEHEVLVLGSVCGYLPAPWLRTELLGYDSSSVEREWVIAEGSVVHRSGLTFPDADYTAIDPTMFHPTTMAESIYKLNEQASLIAGSTGSFELDADGSLGHFPWTQSTISRNV